MNTTFQHTFLAHTLKFLEIISFVTQLAILKTQTAIFRMLAYAFVFCKRHETAGAHGWGFGGHKILSNELFKKYLLFLKFLL